MSALFILLWLLIGVVSFIYWWTKDYDFMVSTLFLALIASSLGPLAFIVGFALHGQSSDAVIIKKQPK